MKLLGLDIGGTKCAAVTANWDGERLQILKKEKCPTDHSVSPETMLERLFALADGILDGKPDAVGISCGGPLDSAHGVILGPPNLPGWDDVPVTALAARHFGAPAHLQNDANACAVAEWKFGAGRGTRNMIFLTFGTGLGAGLILDGQLYSGTNDNAGECGHLRLERFGPVGYGKQGSFEGFCSGGGLAQLGCAMARECVQRGVCPAYYQNGEAGVTAKSIADAARAGDETALEVYRVCGEYLGRGLAVLIDLLNPQRIVLGSIFARSGDLLRESMEQSLRGEALAASAACCQIVAAELGESIGDYAALATALL